MVGVGEEVNAALCVTTLAISAMTAQRKATLKTVTIETKAETKR